VPWLYHPWNPLGLPKSILPVQAKDWFVLGTPSAFTHPIFSQKTEVSLPQFRLPFYLSSIISKIAPFFQTWIMA
jgi:hypothetical protein